MREGRIFLLMVLAIVFLAGSANGSTNLLSNPGFETYEGTGGGLPNNYGDWKGDESGIVGITSEITPYEGIQMLQFEGVTPHGASSSSVSSQVYQLIDMSVYEIAIDAGIATASMSAYFNRIAGDENTDTLFYLCLYACAGEPSSFLTQLSNASYLARFESELYSDDDTATWQLCEQTSMTLPAGTDFIAFSIGAEENIYNNPVYPEFDGHFGDYASVTVIPEPVSILLFGLSALLIRKKK